MRKILVVLLSLILLGSVAHAQLKNPVSWSFEQKKVSANEYDLLFIATIESSWHLYSEKPMDGGPIETSVKFDDAGLFEKIGSFHALSEPKKVFDKSFNMNVEYFSNQVTFVQRVKLIHEADVEVNGYVEFMCCDDESCLPPTEAPFSFILAAEKVIEAKPDNNKTEKSILPFLLLAFLAGLAAILTPCVFPMIPMTVSFFMRGSGNRRAGLITAFVFGLSIVLIYTLLGALFSLGVFGPNAGAILSTHWIPNAIFFILFAVFALSFFGLFELVLPGSLANKTDAKADKGGIAGAFFMALTTVIVSFSCTGPFIGYLIIEAVQGGGMRPLLGMFAFGLAFATPFTLLALFPSALKKLPKSGGWLNVVKVVFAFILLAFGLKFLSNIDQVYGLHLLSREVYLAIWVTIFVVMGFYLLGKIRLAHDSELKHVSVGRLLIAMTSFAFSIYLFTGLMGAPLTAVSSLIPPPSAQTAAISGAFISTSEQNEPECGPAKYSEKLHLPHGLTGYFDYKQGLACAKEQNKPVFLVFKGHACANCKKMENSVWAQPEALSILSNDYVVIALYTDDRTTLPEQEWITSPIDGKILKTMGRINLDLLMSKYNKNTIPYHVIIKPDGTEHELEVTFDNAVFTEFLKKGLQ